MAEIITEMQIAELLLRGASTGLLLLLAIKLLKRKPLTGVQNLGVLFVLGTAAYVIVSTPLAKGLGPAAVQGLALLAIMNSVFFWWFATALFDDEFQWRAWRLAPGMFMLGLFCARLFTPDILAGRIDDLTQQALIIAMMAHALWLAVAHRRDDLVEPRRKFRLVFASLVGAMGILIAVAELIIGTNMPPAWLTFFHSFLVLGLVVAFSRWLLNPIMIFASPADQPVARKSDATSIDTAARRRLEAAMERGAYRQEGLTVSALANQIAFPEYKLRQLINQGLGYRNFSKFLNSYRVAEAKVILADPARARVQVMQVALELGYASIAPFNRAFKEAENITPSEYRKEALAREPD